MTATRITKTLILMVTAIAVSGCGVSHFSTRRDNPVIEDYVGGWISGQERLGFMATTASHRLVTVRLNTDEGGVGQPGMMCPEPPPDVAQSISDSFAAALQASVTTQTGTEGSGGAAVASAFASTVTPLLRRSQGVQFFRDGMYYLCIARINDVLTDKQYQGLAAQLREDANVLIASEIDNPAFYLPATVEAPAKPVDLPTMIGQIEEIRKLIGETDNDNDDDDDD